MRRTVKLVFCAHYWTSSQQLLSPLTHSLIGARPVLESSASTRQESRRHHQPWLSRTSWEAVSIIDQLSVIWWPLQSTWVTGAASGCENVELWWSCDLGWGDTDHRLELWWWWNNVCNVTGIMNDVIRDTVKNHNKQPGQYQKIFVKIIFDETQENFWWYYHDQGSWSGECWWLTRWAWRWCQPAPRCTSSLLRESLLWRLLRRGGSRCQQWKLSISSDHQRLQSNVFFRISPVKTEQLTNLLMFTSLKVGWSKIIFGCDSSPRSPNVSLSVCLSVTVATTVQKL